jgi:hypothetical protein
MADAKKLCCTVIIYNEDAKGKLNRKGHVAFTPVK